MLTVKVYIIFTPNFACDAGWGVLHAAVVFVCEGECVACCTQAHVNWKSEVGSSSVLIPLIPLRTKPLSPHFSSNRKVRSSNQLVSSAPSGDLGNGGISLWVLGAKVSQRQVAANS